jgi:hypothetical protein
MKLAILAALAIGGCTYNTTNEAALAALSSRLSAIEQREDALESRVAVHGEAIQNLSRRPFK